MTRSRSQHWLLGILALASVLFFGCGYGNQSALNNACAEFHCAKAELLRSLAIDYGRWIKQQGMLLPRGAVVLKDANVVDA